MNEALTATSIKSRSQQKLTCRLRAIQATSRYGPLPNMGEIELENCSTSVIEIEYTMTPLQFLDLAVVGPHGGLVSEGHFSDRFSPTRDPAILRLLPGEKFTATVSLLATVPRKNRVPGTHTIQATYRFQNTRVVAEPLTVEFTSES
ncbi:MAG TPA: hypothetical protein VE988_22740 [Gemmataceae bacterium]|nr:hypothetical protein [Gemmataceae bacterium]